MTPGGREAKREFIMREVVGPMMKRWGPPKHLDVPNPPTTTDEAVAARWRAHIEEIKARRAAVLDLYVEDLMRYSELEIIEAYRAVAATHHFWTWPTPGQFVQQANMARPG